MGPFFADLFIENRLIVELKAAKALADEHIAQILGYLRASRTEHGLLMNFGAHRFEIRKFALSQPDKPSWGGLAKVQLLLSSFFAFFAPFRG